MTDVNVQVQNKINGNFWEIAKENNMCRSYRPLQYVVNMCQF